MPDQLFATASTPASIALQRHYQVNMPQMALGGLSEAWLFRELGDIHWTMISQGLQAPSSQMTDANGDRLYATFTRLSVSSSAPILQFEENEELVASGSIRRFGGGVFFGDVTLSSRSVVLQARLMSSFTKRSSSASNLSLLKGQPLIPSDCAIPTLSELPEFAGEYRKLRAESDRPVLFECDYEIMPYHDINGVGLLYFAAYPTINDLSELKWVDDPQSWCLDTSTVSRDVHYYGNCDISDRIIYRLHSREELEGRVRLTSSLSRASDGATIAFLETIKAIGLS